VPRGSGVGLAPNSARKANSKSRGLSMEEMIKEAAQLRRFLTNRIPVTLLNSEWPQAGY